MIKVSCYTSEDNLWPVDWPKELSVRPMLGEYISSIDGGYSRKIVRIEHVYVRSLDEFSAYSYLSLELSK